MGDSNYKLQITIYRKPDAEVLQLVRMGSHSELFD